jgi:hypothetical protein
LRWATHRFSQVASVWVQTRPLESAICQTVGAAGRVGAGATAETGLTADAGRFAGRAGCGRAGGVAAGFCSARLGSFWTAPGVVGAEGAAGEFAARAGFAGAEAAGGVWGTSAGRRRIISSHDDPNRNRIEGNIASFPASRGLAFKPAAIVA